jgi:hypothetical protein
MQPQLDAFDSQAIMHCFPIFMESDLVGQVEMVFRLFGDGVPVFLGVVGCRPASPDLRELVVAYEWPTPFFVVPSTPLGREELERRHVEEFCTDHLIGSGQLPYTEIKPGPNPPDFVVNYEGVEIKLDCSQFTLAERRQAHATFERLQAEILAQPRERFAHLAGYLIYMWFLDDETGSLVRPFRRATQVPAIRRLIDALADYQPNPERLLVNVTEEFPVKHPGLGAVKSEPGGNFYAVPLETILPSSRFFAATGFELGFGYVTYHSAASAWKEVERLVSQHDRENIDHLLISVGAPNNIGYGFPAEEVLAEGFFQNPQAGMKPPRHLRRVLMHLWASGTIIQIHPEPRALVPGWRPSGFAASPWVGDLPASTFICLSRAAQVQGDRRGS